MSAPMSRLQVRAEMFWIVMVNSTGCPRGSGAARGRGDVDLGVRARAGRGR